LSWKHLQLCGLSASRASSSNKANRGGNRS
jgi:hypothetical protein